MGTTSTVAIAMVVLSTIAIAITSSIILAYFSLFDFIVDDDVNRTLVLDGLLLGRLLF